jgi:D-hexose-6-phosphate mutarotase
MSQESLAKSLEKRFLERVSVRGDDECWKWLGRVRKSDGVGLISSGPFHAVARRVSWELHFQKPIPEGFWVRLGCQTKLCVNPRHLQLATYS